MDTSRENEEIGNRGQSYSRLKNASVKTMVMTTMKKKNHLWEELNRIVSLSDFYVAGLQV